MFKRLKNIEKAQKNLINGNNKTKPDSARSKLSLPSIFDSISSKSKDKDEDENEKAVRELYQDGIKNIEGLDKLLGGTKDEKSQMYIENNLNKIKNNFPNIYIKGLLSILLIGKKNNTDCEILSVKVEVFNFLDRHGTLHEYLNHLVRKKCLKEMNHF